MDLGFYVASRRTTVGARMLMVQCGHPLSVCVFVVPILQEGITLILISINVKRLKVVWVDQPAGVGFSYGNSDAGSEMYSHDQVVSASHFSQLAFSPYNSHTFFYYYFVFTYLCIP
jgi:hypothetical protein